MPLRVVPSLTGWPSKRISRVWLFVTPWTVAHQAPLSMGFSMKEYWSGLPCPPPALSFLPEPLAHFSPGKWAVPASGRKSRPVLSEWAPSPDDRCAPRTGAALCSRLAAHPFLLCRAAAPVGVFSRGTTRISGSLSCGAREVRSPCAWRGGQTAKASRKQSSLSGKESAQGCLPKRLLGRPD